MNWKKYAILSISIMAVIGVAKYAYSCIAEEVYYDYPSFFGNKAPGKNTYRPFFYVSEDQFYNNYADNGQDNSDLLNLENLREWQRYTKNEAQIKDIDSLVNKFSIDDLKKIATKKTQDLPGSKKSNSFAKWLAQNTPSNAARYFVFAKQCEPYVTPQSDWDTLTVNRDSSEILINKGLALWGNSKNHFLQLRYAFQVLRLAFYNKKYDLTLSLYDSLIGDAQPQSPGLTYYRCLGLKAGVCFKKGNYAEAAYLYSKIFDGTDGLKKMSMVSFMWSVHNHGKSDAVIKAAEALCKDNHERAVITVMQALREGNKALPLIQQAYKLDPSVEGIDVLVNREINKMEERYQAHNINLANGIEYDSYEQYFEDQPVGRQGFLADSLRKTYPGYLGQLDSFIQTVIAEKNTEHQAFWHLSSAYISYLLDDTKRMEKEMKLATSVKMTSQDQELYQVFNILKKIKNHATITPAVESQLLPQLRALDSIANLNSDQDHNFFNIMNYLLAPKYLAQKDTIKAVYCMAHSQRKNEQFYGDYSWYFYDESKVRSTYLMDAAYRDRGGVILDQMTIESLHEVQRFEQSSKKTAFESWLVSGTYYDKNTLKELEGTKYLRAFQFSTAAARLKDIPHLDSLAYPFEMHINDITDTIYREDSLTVTTKYSFAKQMAALQQTIQSNPDNAPAIYKYALGLYGMSYYGRSPNLFSYFQSHADAYKYYKTPQRDRLPEPFQEYYGLYTAEQYFNLAARAAKTASLKAKCVFGAAKCWQKRCTSFKDDDYLRLSYVRYCLTNPYFKILKEDYNTSNFAKELYNTCSYYRDYVKKN